MSKEIHERFSHQMERGHCVYYPSNIDNTFYVLREILLSLPSNFKT